METVDYIKDEHYLFWVRSSIQAKQKVMGLEALTPGTVVYATTNGYGSSFGGFLTIKDEIDNHGDLRATRSDGHNYVISKDWYKRVILVPEGMSLEEKGYWMELIDVIWERHWR